MDWGGKVAAWFGVVAGVSVALATLIVTAVHPLHGQMRDLFIVLLALAAVSFVFVLLTGPSAVWAARRNRGRRRKTSDLAARSGALLGELNEFLGERRREDPVLRVRPAPRDDEDRAWRWAEQVTGSLAFNTETMSRYRQRFSIRALAVFDEAVAVGVAKSEDRHCLEYPTNVLGIEDVAKLIGMIAYKARQAESL